MEAVSLGKVLVDLGPHARVATAALPFAVAMLLRAALGKSVVTRWLITLSTMWFLANVLMAPYSAGMREDLLKLTAWFR